MRKHGLTITICLTWQLRGTLDSINNSYGVSFNPHCLRYPDFIPRILCNFFLASVAACIEHCVNSLPFIFTPFHIHSLLKLPLILDSDSLSCNVYFLPQCRWYLLGAIQPPTTKQIEHCRKQPIYLNVSANSTPLWKCTYLKYAKFIPWIDTYLKYAKLMPFESVHIWRMLNWSPFKVCTFEVC